MNDTGHTILTMLAFALVFVLGGIVGYAQGTDEHDEFTCPGGVIEDGYEWAQIHLGSIVRFDSGVWYLSGEPFGYAAVEDGPICVFGSGS